MRRRTGYGRTVELKPSLRHHAWAALLRVMSGKPFTPDTDIAALRQFYQKLDAWHGRIGPGIERTPVDCGGVPGEWVTVPESLPERTILYLHGGSFAFRFPNLHAALAARLCRKLYARALIPDYRLAPEHPFPAAPDDCHTAYRWLLGMQRNPKGIVLAGDSAGGNLALVTLHRARVAAEPMPACAVLMSPAVDCTLQSPSMFDNQPLDPMIQLGSLIVLRAHYVPSPELYTHPEVSPLFADFTGFPPLFFQSGSNELLRDEAMRAAEKAYAAGVDVELELWPRAVHVFQAAEFLPESRLAINHIARFVRMRAGWGVPSRAAARL
jgi:epsilon-lactone hydrolase